MATFSTKKTTILSFVLMAIIENVVLQKLNYYILNNYLFPINFIEINFNILKQNYTYFVKFDEELNFLKEILDIWFLFDFKINLTNKSYLLKTLL